MRAFTLVEADQRSPEWFRARAGRLTGSRAADILATIKSGEAAARRDLRIQLVVERLTGDPEIQDKSRFPDVARGIEKEPEAIAAYEAATGNVVRRTGFLSHNELLIGCSLDGDVDDFTGIVEVKCPRSATHYKYIKGGGLPSDYKPQILHNLLVSGAAWADFVSFDDRMPEGLRLFTVRVERNDFELMAYRRTVEAFLAEVEAEYQQMRQRLEGVA